MGATIARDGRLFHDLDNWRFGCPPLYRDQVAHFQTVQVSVQVNPAQSLDGGERVERQDEGPAVMPKTFNPKDGKQRPAYVIKPKKLLHDGFISRANLSFDFGILTAAFFGGRFLI